MSMSCRCHVYVSYGGCRCRCVCARLPWYIYTVWEMFYTQTLSRVLPSSLILHLWRTVNLLTCISSHLFFPLLIASLASYRFLFALTLSTGIVDELDAAYHAGGVPLNLTPASEEQDAAAAAAAAECEALDDMACVGGLAEELCLALVSKGDLLSKMEWNGNKRTSAADALYQRAADVAGECESAAAVLAVRDGDGGVLAASWGEVAASRGGGRGGGGGGGGGGSSAVPEMARASFQEVGMRVPAWWCAAVERVLDGNDPM